MNIQLEPMPVKKDTRDEATVIEDHCIQVACRKYIDTPNAGSDHALIPEWSIKAMHQVYTEAFEQGQRKGEAVAEAEYRLLSEAMGESFTQREDSLIKSAMLAMLEAIHNGACSTDTLHFPEVRPYAEISIEDMRTIHDRYRLGYAMVDTGRVKLTLEKL
jgi:hypothetical protein